MPKVSKNIRIRPKRELIERDDEVESPEDLPLGYSALDSFNGRKRRLPIYKFDLDFGRKESATRASTRRSGPGSSTGSQVSRVSSFARPDEAPASIQLLSHIATTLRRELNQGKTERTELRHDVSQLNQRVETIERRLDNGGQRPGHSGIQQGGTTPQNGRTKCPYCAKDLAAGSLHSHKKRFHWELVMLDRARP